MSMFFQFAFLGPHNSYLASVTKVTSKGDAVERSKIEFNGLPEQFVEQYSAIVQDDGYIYRVCGHDFLSHFGREWRGEKRDKLLETSAHLLDETDVLKSFKIDNETDDFFLSLGPEPGSGSFFADAFRLREPQYRWANLPRDLENKIQRVVCTEKYGKISGVAMNATGGWVIRLNKGKQYHWGGTLPPELISALQDGQQRKAHITRMYLNHQNDKDYVLIFDECEAFVSLHENFEERLKRLFELTVPKKKKLKWNFIASCLCSESTQKMINGEYYNGRSKFQLYRGNPELALIYAREAKASVEDNRGFEADFALALVAIHESGQHQEIGAFPRLSRTNSSGRNATFPYEYNELKDKFGDFAVQEERWQRIAEVSRFHTRQGATQAWSWSTIKKWQSPYMHELPTLAECLGVNPRSAEPTEEPGSTMEHGDESNM